MPEEGKSTEEILKLLNEWARGVLDHAEELLKDLPKRDDAEEIHFYTYPFKKESK